MLTEEHVNASSVKPMMTETHVNSYCVAIGIINLTDEGRGNKRDIEAEPRSPGSGVQSGEPCAASSGTSTGTQQTTLAFILDLAESAGAVRDAAILAPDACAEAAEAAEVPLWRDVPKACGL